MVRKEKLRQVYFIERKFQTSFILKFCALIIVGSLLTGVLVYSLSQRSTTVVFEHSRALVKSTADFLLPLLIQTIIVVSIIVAIGTIILTMFISHSIAGPLYRLKKELGTVEGGDLTCDFILRRDDQLQDVANSMASMIKGLRDRISDLKNNWRNFKDNWDLLLEKELLSRPSQDIEKFNNIINDIDRNLDYFKI